MAQLVIAAWLMLFGASLGLNKLNHYFMQASALVQEVIEKDRKQRGELVSIYRHVEMYLSRLPPARWRELDSSNPGYHERLLRNITNLERSDCAILIAGKLRHLKLKYCKMSSPCTFSLLLYTCISSRIAHPAINISST